MLNFINILGTLLERLTVFLIERSDQKNDYDKTEASLTGESTKRFSRVLDELKGD